MAAKRDYYEVLGVTRESSVEVITKSYRKLAREHHPDRNIGNAEAEHRFKEVNEAHEVLTNDEKRARYDRYGHAGLEGMGAGGFEGSGSPGDIFSDLINGFFGGGGRRQAGPQPGRDLQMVLDINLREAAQGCKKTIRVPRLEQCGECKGQGSKTGKRVNCTRCGGRGETAVSQGFFQLRQTCRACNGAGSVVTDPCRNCNGDGKVDAERMIDVNVPAGVDTGVRLSLRGEGEAGDPGAQRGNLEVIVRVAEDPHFKRDGLNLACEVPITFGQAALGGTVEIPTLLGTAKLEVPRGTQTHTELRIAGEGMPNLRGGRKGDLRVFVVVETPTKLTERQESLLRELADIENKQVSNRRKGFLDRVKDYFNPPEHPDEK